MTAIAWMARSQRAIARTDHQIQHLGEQPTDDSILEGWLALDFGRQFPYHSDLNDALTQLKAQFPSLEANEQEGQFWWIQYQADWLSQFHEQILKPQNMSFGWNLPPLERQKLREYYKTDQFLVDCLNSECSIAPAVRLGIETKLFSNHVHYQVTPI